MKFSICIGVLFVTLTMMLPSMGRAGDYVIGDGDVLQVSVWGVPDLSVQVTVRPDGKITIPAAGDIEASGLTPAALAENLRKSIRRLVKEPIVTLTVSQITNNRIYVSGGGVPAEVVNMAGRTSLFKFLCRFGTLENADLRHAYLLRQGQKVKADFYKLFWEGDFTQDLQLQAEDILFIPNNELNKVYVVGAVAQPMFIVYRSEMKVLDAILESGGFNEYANRSNITVLRNTGEKIRVSVKDLLKGKDLSQNVSLRPGDYVIVDEGLF